MWKTTPVGNQQSRNPVQFLESYFEGRRISPEFRLRADVNATRVAEQAHFVIRLVEEPSGTLSSDPIFAALFSLGRDSQGIQGWVDGDYFGVALFPNGTRFSLSDVSLELEFFKVLGGLVPPSGGLTVSYSLFSKESRIHRETKQGLDRGYPPVVTPLGFLLFTAGCGMGFKDWHFAEGGREGPEKLQGFKPKDSDMAREKAYTMLQELRAFSNISTQDDLARGCRQRAEQVISELEHMSKEL